MTNKISHLYIHVPFCNSICSYCDFCHRIYNKDLVNKWLNTIKKEIDYKCKDSYETIYIGGGTPSCLSLDELDKLLGYINPYAKNTVEYTIEVNPESLNIEKIDLFKKYGINRISMGVQTSDDNLLKLLNRKHTFTDVIDSVNLLKQNSINNISIDLMYSLPGQTIEILNKTLDDFIKLDVPHVSIYSLTIEDNTIFSKKGYKPLDNDIEADMYELIINKLNSNGYKQYEVSNFSNEGYESKHNIGYWKYDDFLGISMSASSKVGNHRWTNTSSFESYFNDYNSKAEDLTLTNKDQMFENIMMSLRMNNGLDINEFNNRYNCNFEEEYRDAISDENITINNNFIRCRRLGLLNRTLLKFM